MINRYRIIVTGMSAVLFSTCVWAGKNEPATLKSLRGRTVDVQVSEPEPVSAQQKLDAYNDYLSLETHDPLLRAEAMRRQADLYMELGEEDSMRRGTDLRNDPNHLEAIRIYNEIRVEYPDYDKLGLVLYQLSKAYENIGAQEQVLTTLDEVVARWPNGEFIDESQFRRGEILFIRQNFIDASDAYAAVLEYGPESRFYEQALYKHGWSTFKQGDYAPGVESFLTLLDRRIGGVNEAVLSTHIDSMTRAERELFDDTLRVLSLVFSYEDGAGSISMYMQGHSDSQYAYLLYQSLADLYLDKERFGDAADVFSAFAMDYPGHYQSPLFQAQAIDAYRAGNFPSLVLEGKKAYVSIYGLDAPYWQIWEPVARPEVISELKKNLSDLAQYDHARAQQDDDVAAYAAAADWYRLYLEYFPEDPESAERSFLLGEVLVASGQPAEAMMAYQAAAYDYPGFVNAAEAGYAAVLASRAHGMTLAGDTGELWSQQQIHDDLRFATTYPDHPEAAAVMIVVAEELFAEERYTAASIVAGELLTGLLQPDEPQQTVAWRVVAHSRFDQSAYIHAEQAYMRLGTQDISSEELQEVDQRIAASIYRQAEASQAAGDVDAAVYDYLRIADQSDIKPVAVYDAATLLIVSERWSDSIPVLQQFRTAYPNHQFSNDVSQKIAYSYLKAGLFVEAASEFESLANNGALDEDLRREALWQAAELYQEQGQLVAAKRSYRSFVNEFPEPFDESLEGRYRLSELALEMNEPAERKGILQEIIKQDGDAGDQRTERSKYLAAKASLELAEPYRAKFAAIKLSIPLKAALKKKKASMEDALAAYNRAAEYGVAEVTTVATFQVAEIYYQLSVDLLESEKPGGLSADELEQYDILLEEQAFPFEEKAIEIYEVNVARAADGLYDQAIRDSYARLAVLMPGRYAKLERTESYVFLTN